MTAGIGHWARGRLAEHRAIAEYRHAWRRLRRLHAASGQGPYEDDPFEDNRENAHKGPPPHLHKEEK